MAAAHFVGLAVGNRAMLLTPGVLVVLAAATTGSGSGSSSSAAIISSTSPTTATATPAAGYCCNFLLRLVLGVEGRQSLVQLRGRDLDCCHRHLFGREEDLVCSFEDVLVGGMVKRHIADVGAYGDGQLKVPKGFYGSGAATPLKLGRLLANVIN